MGNCFRTIMSHVLSFSERFAIFISFTSILTCAVACMLCMLAFGIGLGYNYSYVDYRARHNYVKGEIKRATPKSYFGPGFYKPTTRYPNRHPKKSDIRKRVEGAHKLDPDVTFKLITDPPHGLPNESPIAMVEAESDAQPEMEIEKGPKLPIARLYFNITTKARLLTVSLNDSTTEMMTDLSTDTTIYTQARRHEEGEEEVKEQFKEGNAYNDSDVKTIKYLSDHEESVTVNVTKTRNDTDDPFIIKTMMHPNHLSKWLSRLRKANKTFAVHVITN